MSIFPYRQLTVKIFNYWPFLSFVADLVDWDQLPTLSIDDILDCGSSQLSAFPIINFLDRRPFQVSTYLTAADQPNCWSFQVSTFLIVYLSNFQPSLLSSFLIVDHLNCQYFLLSTISIVGLSYCRPSQLWTFWIVDYLDCRHKRFVPQKKSSSKKDCRA